MTPQRLTLDFAAPAASAYGGRVLLGVGLVALLVGGLNFALAWEQRNRGQFDLATLVQRNSVQHRSARTATAADAAALRAVTLVSRDLSAPWSELMRSMEASQSVDISLVRIEPVAAAGSLRITGDARHADAMIDYLEQLRAQGLAEVVLTSHQVQLQQPGKPIRFQAQARWSDLATAASPGESLGPISTPTPPELAPSADRAVPLSMPAGAFDETERFLVNSRAAR